MLSSAPKVEEILEDGSAIVLAPVGENAEKALAVPAAEKPVAVKQDDEKSNPLALIPFPESFDCVVSHGTVVKTAAAAVVAGSSVGGVLFSMAAPEIAQKVSDKVRDAVKKTGDEMTAVMLKETGFDKVPGAKFFVQAEVTDLAHKAGEEAYKQTVKTVTAKGAVVGGGLAGGVTILSLEALNAMGYAYNRLIAPVFARRRDQALAKQSQKLSQETMKGNGLVATEVGGDDADLQDFLMLEEKNKKPSI